MSTVDIRELDDSFVIHFGSSFKRINAYTLASTLVAVSDAVKKANNIVNPGYDVEIVVEALGEGSFKTKIKAVYNSIGNVFSSDTLKAIILNIIASYIYQITLAPNTPINVKIDGDCVVIEQANQKVIIPKEVHEALKKVERSKAFKDDIGRAVAAVEKDKDIQSFGIAKKLDYRKPSFEIMRENFSNITADVEEQGNERHLTEVADLQILKAILERTKRRWEFVWRGVKISAPVTDQQFYSDFFSHKITIAPGDSLKVKLRIHQVRDTDTGIYTNKKYEVIEVMEHMPKPKQIALDIDHDT
ncbi:hypothetical protein [Geomonas agri]|uniref:hypothetical protein n=1 Tax=Geomonas agri TaxID=2873702 RepID=UPI001CD21BE9|nr:hypothetical protein [Geomonas agri]